MGAKTALLPGLDVVGVEDGNLAWNINPPDGVLYAGVFRGLIVICASELGEVRPGDLRPGWVAEGAGRRVVLHSMHSVSDFLSFAVWGTDGTLERALCLSPDHGIVEDRGDGLDYLVLDRGGENYLQVATGARMEIPPGTFWVERREGSPDLHFRCEVDTRAEVAEIFRGYLVNQDGRGGHQWTQIRL